MRNSVSMEKRKSLKRGLFERKARGLKKNWSSFPISPEDLGFELGLQSQATHIKVLLTRRHKAKFQSLCSDPPASVSLEKLSSALSLPAQLSLHPLWLSAFLSDPTLPAHRQSIVAAGCRLQSTYKQHLDKVRTSRDTILISKFLNQMGHDH